LLVEEDGALRARHDEVDMDEETEPGVEGDPIEDEVELVFNQQEEGEGGPVHQPWREHGGVGCTKSFVGEEDGKEDGRHGRENVGDEAKHVGWWTGLKW